VLGSYQKPKTRLDTGICPQSFRLWVRSSTSSVVHCIMLRIAVMYILIAILLLVYLMVVSKDGEMLERSRADVPGKVGRVENSFQRGHRSSGGFQMASPSHAPRGINGERRLVRTMLQRCSLALLLHLKCVSHRFCTLALSPLSLFVCVFRGLAIPLY
jgi:hypothetical protein